MPETVDVVLDLRNARRTPASADDFVRLWTEIEGQLAGACLREAAAWRVETPSWGQCGLLLTDPEAAPAYVTGETGFAVRAVWEPSKILYRCGICSAHGQETYGPFSCEECKSGGQADRVCDQHAVILDGSFRATCPRHAPACSCGAAATFWCRGRGCRSATAYCDRHRHYHPGDRNISYCLSCYAAQFPACGHPGCLATGSLACEYVDPDGARCGARACTRHAFRWQIFGPRRRGLALCLSHARRLRRLSRQELAFELVASSCLREDTHSRPRTGARPHETTFLPRLSVVRHIFINTLGEALDMGLLGALFTQLQENLGRSGLEGRMRHRLEQQEKTRTDDIEKFRNDTRDGLGYFTQLQRIVAGQGNYELAAQISFSDFRPKSNILFVRVPDSLVGAFIGQRGTNIKSYSAALGLTVKVERK